MHVKLMTLTRMLKIPAIVRINFKLFWTVANEIPLKSFSQASLSEYLASNQAVASS